MIVVKMLWLMIQLADLTEEFTSSRSRVIVMLRNQNLCEQQKRFLFQPSHFRPVISVLKEPVSPSRIQSNLSTTATLGIEESDSCREVAVMGR